MSIKRYAIRDGVWAEDGVGGPYMAEVPGGEFVSHDDHVAEVEHLTADLAAARAEVSRQRSTIARLDAALNHEAAERDGLARALATTKDAVWAAHDFLLRECREDNPEKGIVVDESALPAWNLLCDAIDALAALPPKEDDDGA